MLKLPLAFVALVVAAMPAAAQDNDQADGDSGPVSGKAAFGYLATSGNTESTNANGALTLLYTLPTWAHSFDFAAIAASTSNQTTAEAYAAAYEGRRALSGNGYVFAALDWNRDRFSGYAEQMSQTVGYGRRLIDGERHVLNGGLGAGARQAELRNGAEQDEAIVRGSLDYLWTVSTTAEFGQALVVESGSTNTSVESVSTLRSRLFGNVSLVLSYRLKHNSSVPAEAENADRFSSISLEYAF